MSTRLICDRCHKENGWTFVSEPFWTDIEEKHWFWKLITKTRLYLDYKHKICEDCLVKAVIS